MVVEEQLLKIFRREDGFISGEELSQSLGVSRSAVWKHIEKLREEGYEIIAQPHTGYRLAGLPDKLLPAELGWGLRTKLIGKKIYSYNEVDSTNNLAWQFAEKGEPEGACVFAESQTKGRGRLGRKWFSPPGKGVYLSLILRPDVLPQQAPFLTILSAVSAVKAVRKVTGLSTWIKWPNDIIINKKKAGGILTEMSAETDRVKFLILGMGINVNNDRDSLPSNATSLKIEFGNPVSRIALAQEILRELEFHYLRWVDGKWKSIRGEWQNLSETLGKRVAVVCHGRSVEGNARDIDEDGGLLLRRDNGIIEKVIAGDVINMR